MKHTKLPFTILILLLVFLIGISCKFMNNKKIGNSNMTFYIGTYTNGNSEGIYKYRLHNNGKMELIGLATQSENPSFLAKHPDKPFILATNEVDVEGTGIIEIFHEYQDSLVLLSRDLSFGAHACHISANSEGYVLTSNYSGGNISLFRINPEGKLTSFMDTANHIGNGMHWRQDAPHAHWAEFDPFSNKVFAADLGTNELWVYDLKEENDQAELKIATKIAMADSAGPRCFAFHPKGKWIYVLNELNNTVTRIARAEGSFQVEHSTSTLPTGFTEENTSGYIEISTDGNFLYTSNRGHNSIAVFAINSDTGNLELQEHVSTRGTTPRHFSLVPNEQFLIVANQDSENLVCFKRDSISGSLKYISEINAPSPTCILF